MDIYNKLENSTQRVFDFKDLFRKVLKKWYFFLLTIPLGLFIAFVKIYMTHPYFEATGSLLVNQENDGNTLKENKYLEGGISLLEKPQNLIDEIEVLKSFSLIRRVVEKLDLNISYFQSKKFKEQEVYKSTPFQVIIDKSEYQIIGVPIYVRFVDKNTIQLHIETKQYSKYNEFEKASQGAERPLIYKENFQLGEWCESDFFRFKIVAREGWNTSDFISTEEALSYFFVINPIDHIANNMQSSLTVYMPNEDASILKLQFGASERLKATEFLNQLIKEYQQSKLDEKNEYAARTIEFINSQLSKVTDTLEGVERKLLGIRSDQSTLNLNESAKNSETLLRTLESEAEQYELKISYFEKLLIQLNQEETIGTIVSPSALGIDDPIIVSLVLELKQLNSEKVSLKYKSPESVELDILNRKIEFTVTAIKENIQELLRSAEMNFNDLNNRIDILKGNLSRMPYIERSMDRINRDFELNDNLYNYLLQLRSEAEIALAANRSDIQIIENARLIKNGRSLAPNKKLIIAVSLFLSVFITVFAIWALELMKGDIIKEVEEISEVLHYPIISTIPHAGRNVKPQFQYADYRIIETFRFLKVNLSISPLTKEKKVFGITSYMPNEGKNFCSVNFAVASAIYSDRTILLNFDLRNPTSFNDLSEESSPGLVDYLFNGAMINEIIFSSPYKNLDYISSGTKDGYDGEIFSTQKVEMLIYALSQSYDTIIINTPPVGLVSDYLIISQYIDITFYVVRQSYSRVSHLRDVKRNDILGNLKNVYIIFNDVEKELKKYKKYGKSYDYVPNYEKYIKSEV